MVVVLLILCFGLGALAVTFSVRGYLEVRSTQRNGLRATARVVEFIPVRQSSVDDDGAASESTELVPLFRLEIEGNEGELTYVKGLPSKRTFTIGDEVRVRYLGDHKWEAQMEGTADGRTDLAGAAASAVFFWGCGAVILLRWRAERRATVGG